MTERALAQGVQGVPPAPCPWCGAPTENVKIHGVEDDGESAVFDIECAACLTRDKARMMRREPDWMEAARGR